MVFEQALLDESAERGIKARIFQLVFMMLILGSDLLQTIHCLVVRVWRGAVFFVKCHYALRFRFDLLIFGFGGIQLHLVICGVQFGQQLTSMDTCTVFYVYFPNGSAYPESQVDVLCGFHFSRVLQGSLAVGRNNGVKFHRLRFSDLLCTIVAGD